MNRRLWVIRIGMAVAFAFFVRWFYGGWGPKQWVIFTACISCYFLGIFVKAMEQRR